MSRSPRKRSDSPEKSMDVFEAIKTRRSIRKYKNEAVPEEDLEKIIEAARLSPSASNNQPWRFIIVRDQRMKGFLAKSVGPQGFVSEVGAVIVVLGDPEVAPYWYMMDPMIAAEHIVLAATALGYGTCWIGALGDWVPENAGEVKKAEYSGRNVHRMCFDYRNRR